MREDKEKITVEYTKLDKLVMGYYPNDIDYSNKTFKDTNDIGYLEIDRESWESRPKPAIVNSNIDGIIEYEKSSDELLEEAKSFAIGNRKNYLHSTDWYISREYDETGTYPTEIKSKRITARSEINAIVNETDINNVTVDFN